MCFPRRFVVIAWSVATLSLAPAATLERFADSPIQFLYGDGELFPSMLVSLSERCRFIPSPNMDSEARAAPPSSGSALTPRSDIFGDATSVLSVRVVAPRANAIARVTFPETSLYATSTISTELPEAGKTYLVAPTLRWNHERLARLKQPIANFVITVIVEVDGVIRSYDTKAVVHSVNDWLQRYMLRGENRWVYSAKYLVAAYVNENNPLIDREITRTALREGYVKRFAGYRGGSATQNKVAAVDEDEIEAVYRALQKLGFKYTALSHPSYRSTPRLEDARVLAQAVRLSSDTLASRQANGLEGGGLLASVYRKLGLEVVFILVPDFDTGTTRCIIAVSRVQVKDGAEPLKLEDLIFIDPELIGSASFAASKESGRKLFQANRDKLFPLAPTAVAAARTMRYLFQEQGYLWIELRYARANGVLPIPEF